jgi:EAL domain-containing protein (putative c-di-GMP-specific phosphodiesterase class I)/DNA-binding NarL/FixJ family response regulator
MWFRASRGQFAVRECDSFSMSEHPSSPRILVIDDNAEIHHDFRKILSPTRNGVAEIAASEEVFFGVACPSPSRPVYQLDSALQGQQGVELVRVALREKRPYAMAFVDVRMPPGWDGIETVTRLWECDPDVQVVICTAYSDYSWEQTRERLGHAHRFIVLKKPFDNIEVLQLAEALTEKWRRGRQERYRLQDLESRIHERNRDLQVIQGINAQLDAANRQLKGAGLAIEDTQVRKRQTIEQELRQALTERTLSVHYQPLVEIASRRLIGLEALARWQHPERGWVSPGEFIPVAEATGLIIPLGEFILRTVCEQAVRWGREGVPSVRVAVNLSAAQLEHESIELLVRKVLRETGLSPHQLALELTESTLMKNLKQHASALHALRTEGVHIEIDDFGTGFSSLSCLRTLPIDGLKIDRSFIQQLETNTSDERIVAAILTLAKELNLQVVAEGVERAAQLQVLGRHGCEVAQGFYFSRPLPPEECRDLLREVGQQSLLTDTLRLRTLRVREEDAATDRTDEATNVYEAVAGLCSLPAIN